MSKEEFERSFQKARLRLIQMHYESNSGHIGGNLSSLNIMIYLYLYCMQSNDEFILSKGHAAGALYIILWLKGFISEEELNTFHKNNTRLPGHPSPGTFSQVPFGTGSLGHGLSLSTGMALAKKLKEEAGIIFCLTSDGEWNEGSTWEALIFAAHHKLNNLIVIIDHNGLQGFGANKDIANLDPLFEKLSNFNAEVIEIDGHSYPDLVKALKPSNTHLKIVIANTIKGNGVSFMANKMEWHYLPLTENLYKKAIEEMEKSL